MEKSLSPHGAEFTLIPSRLIIDRPPTYQKNRIIVRTVFHIRPQIRLSNLYESLADTATSMISAPRSWIIIVRIVDRTSLTSLLRNRDLRRLAICQNRVWLWDLFPKRSRTILPCSVLCCARA